LAERILIGATSKKRKALVRNTAVRKTVFFSAHAWDAHIEIDARASGRWYDVGGAAAHQKHVHMLHFSFDPAHCAPIESVMALSNESKSCFVHFYHGLA
jgi:hypothetical protein